MRTTLRGDWAHPIERNSALGYHHRDSWGNEMKQMTIGVLIGALAFWGLQRVEVIIRAQSRPVTFGNQWFKAEVIDVNGTCALVAYNASRPDTVSIAPCR